MQEIREAMEGAGVPLAQIGETERRLLEMAEEERRSTGAAAAFAEALVETEAPGPRVPAAERARIRKQRKRERQARRAGRRSKR